MTLLLLLLPPIIIVAVTVFPVIAQQQVFASTPCAYGWPPRSTNVLPTDFAFRHCAATGCLTASDVAYILWLMKVTYSQALRARNATRSFDLYRVMDVLTEQQPTQGTDAYRWWLAGLESFAPPVSFIEALNALTIEQKGHIQELMDATIPRYPELRTIYAGILYSLPDEDQIQAKCFTDVLNGMMCQASLGNLPTT